MSDLAWQALIAAAMTIYFDWRTRQAKNAAADAAIRSTNAENAASAAAAVAQNTAAAVKSDLDVASVKHEAKLETIVAKVEEVKNATNGLTSRLIEKTEAEGVARGTLQEKVRVEEEKNSESPPGCAS